MAVRLEHFRNMRLFGNWRVGSLSPARTDGVDNIMRYITSHFPVSNRYTQFYRLYFGLPRLPAPRISSQISRRV
jgi:hypothetical protein